MTNEIIERVARVIDPEAFRLADGLVDADNGNRAVHFTVCRGAFERARAVIEAIREPTPQAQEALFDLLSPGYCETEVEAMQERGDLGSIWTALVDAALS